MKRKQFISFWIGFFLTAAIVAWLYWLWQQRREVTPRPLIVSSPSRRSAVPPPAKAATPEPDDLTAIKGIGPVFAERLNNAGIFTYTQLAAQAPEKLQAITQVTRWDPADWIAEAKKLA